MDPTVLAIALVIVGLVSNRLIRHRFPTVTSSQIYCAIAAWIGGVLIAGRPVGSQFWHYTGLTIAVVMGTFLFFELLRCLNSSRPSGPA